MDRPKKGRSARWGGACAPCAAAKTRCIRTQPSGSQQCDRCRSLEKNCIGQTSGPRKKRLAKSSVTRMALPAGGRNNLVKSSKTSQGENSSLHDLTNNHSTSSISTLPQAQDTQIQLEIAPNIEPHEFNNGAAPSGPKCTCMATIDIVDAGPLDSDKTLLSIYRNQLCGLLPFVIIPADTTPEELQASRPFLMKVIRMVASVRHLQLMRRQSRAVMEHISNAILIRSERSLDLLQGILVFIGYYHYHCMAHAQFNNLIRLAVSLVEDLSLNACPKPQKMRSQLPLVRAEETVSRTNEEKRALLGVWYMSSNAVLLVKQLTFTRYTKYMDQCLKDLDDAREYNTDQLAIQLIRTQKLTEKIFQFHSCDSVVDDEPDSPKFSLMARLDAFRVELDSLKNALPPHLKSNYFLSCYHSSAYLRIFAPLLAGSHLPDAESQSFASFQLSGVLIADIFSNFTDALKAWLENWLAVPVCSYFYMPQPAYVQLVYGAMMVSQWVKVAGPRAVKRPSLGSAMLQKEFTDRQHPTPALSGVPPCPDLSFPRPPASLSSQAASAQILHTVRAKIIAQPHLQINVLDILDTMGARFEAAKNEMTAAQGMHWENDTWDTAAEHVRTKKSRIERWCEMVPTVKNSGTPLTNVSGNEDSRDCIDLLREQSADDLGWVTSGFDLDSMQWESIMFDEILQDIHT